jgi:exonuclease SbcC
VASFFASSSESAHLLAMQHQLKERIRTTKRAEAELRTRLDEVERTLDRLAGLPGAGLGLEAAREAFERSRGAALALPGLERTLAGARELGRRIGLGQARRATLEPVLAPPALWPAAGLAGLLGSVRRLGAAEAGAARRLAGLAALESRAVPALFDVRRLARAGASLAEGALKTGAAQARLAGLAPLDRPPALFPVQGLAKDLARCRQLGEVTARLESRVRVLGGLGQGPALAPVAGLDEACRSLRGLATREARAAADLAGCDARLEALRQRIEARLAEIGDCPLCGGTLDAGHFLKGEHGRGAA